VVAHLLNHVTPGEMDLMACIANWQRSPFDAGSRAHISVYG